MARYFLTKLAIEGFRGINNKGNPLEIKFKEDSVNSLFGRNGLGKSSIYEALCYAIRGYIPKLKSLHADEDANNYYCNRFHDLGTGTIDLTFKPDDGSADVIIAVSRASDGTRTVTSPTGHASPAEFLSAFNDDFTLLDYQSFSGFITDTPLNRGRFFSSLLGLAKVSQMRQALERVADKRNWKHDFNITALEQAQLEAAQSIDAATRDIKIAYGHIMATDPPDINNDHQLKIDIKNLFTGQALVKDFFIPEFEDVDFLKIKDEIKNAEGSDTTSQLAETAKNITELEALAAELGEADEERDLIKAIADAKTAYSKTKGPLFKVLYQDIKKILESGEWHDIEYCPACESKPQIAPKDFTNTQLQQYDEVIKLQEEVVKLWTTSKAMLRMKKLEKHSTFQLKDEEQFYTQYHQRFEQNLAQENDVREAFEKLKAYEERRVALLKTLGETQKSLSGKLTKSYADLMDKIANAEKIQKSLKQRSAAIIKKAKIDAQIKKREDWRDFIEKVSEDFSATESAFSKVKTASIENSYKSFYQMITGSHDIIPVLSKSASGEDLQLKLESFFGAKGALALPLLSESYRNALAISIFLSAALENKSTSRFIVLDDITSSFDSGHQWMLMELLRTKIGLPHNLDGLQVIVLTHDGLLEKYFNKQSNEGQWHHQRLQGTSPVGSVYCETADSSKLKAEAIFLIDGGKQDQAERLMRQYLEYKLLQVIEKVDVPVPYDFAIRDDQKMVENCNRAINAAVDLHEKAHSIILTPQQITNLRTIHVPAIVANWLSHYATQSISSVMPGVLKGVLDTVDQYADCFCYDCSCNGPTRRRYYKNLSERACKCV